MALAWVFSILQLMACDNGRAATAFPASKPEISPLQRMFELSGQNPAWKGGQMWRAPKAPALEVVNHAAGQWQNKE